MDGHFVPNLSMGPVVVKGLRPVTKLPLEVHLMVEKPSRFVDSFLHVGADTLIVHFEVLDNPLPLLQEIRGQGRRVGLAINPGTRVDVLKDYLTEIDLALCMTVWPGFGGQTFLPESPDRIRELRALIEKLNPQCELEVDGATVLVAGTAIFGSPLGPVPATEQLTRISGDEVE
jgi:ribulose-phosphate 3-epimerase